MSFEKVLHIGYDQGYTHVIVDGKVRPMVDYIKEIESENLQLKDRLSKVEKDGGCRCGVDKRCSED